MQQNYTDKLIEQFERFQSGEMDDAERSAFEGQLQADPDLQKLFDQHNLFVEGLQMSAYLKDRAHWRAVKQAIDAEKIDDAEKGEPDAGPATQLIKKRRPSFLWLLAALFTGVLIGITGSGIYFMLDTAPAVSKQPDNTVPIASEMQDEDIPLGYSGRRLELNAEFFEAKRTGGVLQTVRRGQRSVVLHEQEQPFASYRMGAGSLDLYLSAAATSAVSTAKIEWIEVQGNAGATPEQYLKLDNAIFRLIPTEDPLPLGSLPDDGLLHLK